MTRTPAPPPAIDGLNFVSRLGGGGYSDVYLYQRLNPHMNVAVKVLSADLMNDTQLQQFTTEAEIMATLADHPYIVPVVSAGATADGRPFLVMQYYPPPDIGARCRSVRFSVAQVLRIGVKLASAVDAAHRAGILHRDIKPANVLVSKYGEPALTDFGIAGRADDLSRDGDLGVSIPWSPPEVLSGESNGSRQGDVYSLAATVWHLLAGRPPFDIPGGDNTLQAVLARVLAGSPPVTGRADVPAELERMLQQAMSKRPSDRPRTAAEFAQHLQAVEQELRLPRTDIAVAGGITGLVPPVMGDVPGSDATRLRAPTRVVAQPPGPGPRPSPFAPAVRSADGPGIAPSGGAQQLSDRASRRDRGAGDEPAATVLRPARPGSVAERPVDAPPAAGRHRGVRTRWAILAGSALLIVAAGTATALSVSHSRPGGSTDTGNTQAPPDQLAGFDPPQQPIVVASAPAADGPGTVTFTWTYGNPEPGDYFVWYTATGGAHHRVSRESVAIPTGTAHNPACLIVQVVRTDGQASIPSGKVCE